MARKTKKNCEELAAKLGCRIEQNWMRMDGVERNVYEVFAPEHRNFGDGAHSNLAGWTVADLYEELENYQKHGQECEQDCDCRFVE